MEEEEIFLESEKEEGHDETRVVSTKPNLVFWVLKRSLVALAFCIYGARQSHIHGSIFGLRSDLEPHKYALLGLSTISMLWVVALIIVPLYEIFRRPFDDNGLYISVFWVRCTYLVFVLSSSYALIKWLQTV